VSATSPTPRLAPRPEARFDVAVAQRGPPQSAHIRAWTRATTRSKGTTGSLASTCSTKASRRARILPDVARWTPCRSSDAVIAARATAVVRTRRRRGPSREDRARQQSIHSRRSASPRRLRKARLTPGDGREGLRVTPVRLRPTAQEPDELSQRASGGRLRTRYAVDDDESNSRPATPCDDHGLAALRLAETVSEPRLCLSG
jgi:hypothetical protein